MPTVPLLAATASSQGHFDSSGSSSTHCQGYGKENIGRNSKFLQGEETEGYMVEEIMHALQQHEPLCCKLHNHKADGKKFQNLLCLHPVFGREGEYLYQVGTANSLQHF